MNDNCVDPSLKFSKGGHPIDEKTKTIMQSYKTCIRPVNLCAQR